MTNIPVGTRFEGISVDAKLNLRSEQINESSPVYTIEDIAAATSGLSGSYYVLVNANGTPVENAEELKEKYELAKSMTTKTNITSYAVSNVIENVGVYTILFTNNNSQNDFNYGLNNVIIDNIPYTINVISKSYSFGMEVTGLPSGLSFTSIDRSVTSNVKVSLIVAPGEYNVGTQVFILDNNFVDVVSLTGNADVKLVGASYGATALRIAANNILVKGIHAVDASIQVTDNLNNLIVENCKGGAYSFTSYYPYTNISGTFNNCVGGSDSFASYGGNLSGTFNNCIGGSNSFSPMQGQLSGTFNNCKGDYSSFSPMQGNIFGTFNNCTGGSSSFTGSGLYGTFENCKAEYGSFTASSIYGMFNNCKGNSNCFKSIYSGNATFKNCQAEYNSFDCNTGQDLNGTFIGCVATYQSFGSTDNCTVSATLINCKSGNTSFAGGVDSVFQGLAINCSAESQSFASNSSSSITERIKGKIINCQIISGSDFPGSANFNYYGELAGCWDSSGFIASRKI